MVRWGRPCIVVTVWRSGGARACASPGGSGLTERAD